MSNTIIEVKCDSDTSLYFRKQTDNDWQQLTLNSPNPPVINTVSTTRVTYEFVKYSGSTYEVYFKEAQQTLPTSNGPTQVVASGGRQSTEFAKDDSSHTFYQGYVAVSEDGF